MFEAGLDQASGLRRLLGGAPVMPVIALGCGTADRSERTAALALGDALSRAGWNPLLVDLMDCPADDGLALESSRVSRVRPDEARAFLAHGHDLRRLAGATARLRVQAFDILLAVAEPLRLADLAAGFIDRMVLLARADPVSLARAYAQVKAVALSHGLSDFVVAFLDAGSDDDALVAHERLARTASRFLAARVAFGGDVSSDAQARKCWDRLALLACSSLPPAEISQCLRHS